MEESKGLIKKLKRGQAQTIISIVGLRHREDKREYQAKYVGGRLSEWMLLPDLLRTHAKSSTREGTQRSAIGEMVHQFDQDWAGSKNGGGDSDVEDSDVEEQFFRAALNASITDTKRLGGGGATSSRCKLQLQQVLVVVAVAAVIVVLVLLFLELCPGWRLRASEVDISQRQRVAVIR